MPKNPNAVQKNKMKLFIFRLYYEKMPKCIYFKHIFTLDICQISKIEYQNQKCKKKLSKISKI